MNCETPPGAFLFFCKERGDLQTAVSQLRESEDSRPVGAALRRIHAANE